MPRLSNFEKRRKNTKGRMLVHLLLLLLLAIIMTVLPLPQSLKWLWPHWILLLVIYETIMRPGSYGIFFGFLLGVIVDLLLSNKLGVHALSYTLICYFLLKVHHKIYLFGAVQHGLLAFLILVFDSTTMLIFSNVKLSGLFVQHCLLSALSTALIWVFMVSFLGLKRELSKIR